LAAGVTGFLVSPVYPWDGLGVLALCAGCGALLAWGRTALAAAFFVAGISQPVFYAGQGYGIASPANAAFLLGIVLAGLVVGGWFLGMWTAGYCLWMLGLAWGELTGRWTPPGDLPVGHAPSGGRSGSGGRHDFSCRYELPMRRAGEIGVGRQAR
ncbi:MAG TPA: hypothetical protein VFM49_06570, partial [Chloroflexia bacterium]|nr:hypothetical protein [Chloroflexia bacterium]